MLHYGHLGSRRVWVPAGEWYSLSAMPRRASRSAINLFTSLSC